jgi:hypothetical protein
VGAFIRGDLLGRKVTQLGDQVFAEGRGGPVGTLANF